MHSAIIFSNPTMLYESPRFEARIAKFFGSVRVVQKAKKYVILCENM